VPIHTTPAEKALALDAITIDQREAERLTGLSAKTLERRAAEGEPVGRVKIHRRVLFVRKQLEAWINSKLNPPTVTN
jgi:predicted DNA-binding transcriptional regulator AlpA